jgi:hypothetical protein
MFSRPKWCGSDIVVRPNTLGLDSQQSPMWCLDLGDSQVQKIWIWHMCQTQITWTSQSVKFKTLEFRNPPSPRNVGLTCVLDAKYLDLVVKSKTFGLRNPPSPRNVGLACVLDLKYLDLAITKSTMPGRGTQPSLRNMDLTCVLDSRRIDLAINQV